MTDQNYDDYDDEYDAGEKLFFGGLPTTIEVNKLKETYPIADMEPGFFVSYDDLESLLDLEKTKTRFRTVTNRWRRVVENEANVIFHPVPGEGLKVLSESEKITLATKKVKSAGRMGRRAFVIGTRVDRKLLDKNELKALDHVAQRSAKLSAMSQMKQRLELPSI